MFQVMPRMITYFRVRGCGREVAEDLAQEVMLAAYTQSSGSAEPGVISALAL